MVLSDRTIRTLLAEGKIVVEPLGEGCIQPASVDIHLDKHILVFRNSRRPYIDVREDLSDLTEMEEIGEQPFMLHPGEFVLGSTLETIEIPDDLVARLEGKSSLGRIGLLIHSTAGYVDPGWKGHLTLELSNVANLPITLYHGMKIGQLSFLQLSTPADSPYGSPGLGSKYQGQTIPTASRAYRISRTARTRTLMQHMKRALTLGCGALGTTSPNPAVGCVIVHGGEVVGEGWTHPPGQKHAEAAALQMAGARAQSATLYTTLEPCNHYGRTPPCSESIITAGIAEVRIAVRDPNPNVAGGGVARLEEAGSGRISASALRKGNGLLRHSPSTAGRGCRLSQPSTQ